MKTIFYIKGDTLVATLSGEIDHHVAGEIRCDIDEEMEMYCVSNLILDFTDVTFMDSSGVGMVLGRYKKVSAGGGTMKIANCQGIIRRIMEMSGVFSLIEYIENYEEGMEDE